MWQHHSLKQENSVFSCILYNIVQTSGNDRMDPVKCSLCGKSHNPKNSHSCTSEYLDNLFSESDRDKLVESVDKSQNIVSEGISDPRAEGGHTERKCLLEQDPKNIFSQPDHSASSSATPIPIQSHRNPPDVSTSSLKSCDGTEKKSANFSDVQVGTSQGVTSSADDNRSNPSYHFPSEPSDSSTGETGDCLSVLAAPEVVSVAGPSGNQAQRPTNDEGNPFVCDRCSKRFSGISNLRRHLRTHTKDKPYRCPQCSKAFSDSSNLRRHLRNHTEEQAFACGTCGKRFSQSNNLKRHLRTHTEDKPFTCDLCGKSFSDNSNIKRHLRTHTKEKLFVCDRCGKAYAQSSNLKRHLRTHTGENPS